MLIRENLTFRFYQQFKIAVQDLIFFLKLLFKLILKEPQMNKHPYLQHDGKTMDSHFIK